MKILKIDFLRQHFFGKFSTIQIKVKQCKNDAPLEGGGGVFDLNPESFILGPGRGGTDPSDSSQLAPTTPLKIMSGGGSVNAHPKP